MRKEIRRIVEQDFYEALTLLGYTKIRQDNSEWRRHQFHLFIRKKGKRGLTLSIHEDTPSHMPPFHRAVQKGKPLEKELNKILEAYQRKREVRL